MAMIRCSSCGRDVSDQVETCIYCGGKITKGTSWVPSSSDAAQKNSGEWNVKGTEMWGQSRSTNSNAGTGLSNLGASLWEKFMGLSNSKKILTVFLVVFLGIPFLKGFFAAFFSYGSSNSRSYNYSSSAYPTSSALEVTQTSEVDDGKIAMPVVSTSLIGENYVDVEKILKGAGFQNIVFEPIDDLVTGWMVSDGDVEKVSVGGYTSFDTSSRFAADTEIVISYHTFSEDTDTKTVASVDGDEYLKEATDLLDSIYDENMTDIDYVKEAADLINSATGSASNGSGQTYQCIGIDFHMPDYYILDEEEESEKSDFLYFDDGIILVYWGQSNNSEVLDKDNIQDFVKEMGMDENYKLTGDSSIKVAEQSAELIEYEDKGGENDIIGAAVGIKNGNSIAVLIGMWEVANGEKYREDFYQMLNNAKKSSDSNAGNSNTGTNASGMTMSQKNAVQAAKDYLAIMSFSRKGLIEQLSSQYGDGYSVSDATYAVDYLEKNGLVDWNEQAKQSAQEYLSIMSFSKKELIEQLSSEYGDGFTREQAEYAAQALGY